jgi:Ca2+-binding RTX toxin-like protein
MVITTTPTPEVTMSHTTRPRRLARFAAGLAVTAGATATTLLGATPAFAQTNSVTTTVTGGTLNVVGTGFGDSVTANGGSGTVTLSNLLGSIKAGTGCTQLGATVRCTGVNAVQFSGLGGDDTFRNNTSTRSFLSGGAGSDRITGGPGADVIRGGSGTDFAFGQGGTDICTAETESGCES